MGSEPEWGGRPFNDPRNNFTIPRPDAGPKRDILASPIRVCVLDIETSGLNANFGRVLCAVARFFSPDELQVWRADDYQPWKEGRRSDDSLVVKDILLGIDDADIIIAHNGLNFDVPFLRTRAIMNGFPPVNPKKIYDPVMMARRVFRFSSNKLETINKALGCQIQKTELNPDTWVRAYGDGDRACMDEIVEHCKADVDSLAETARRMAPYIKTIDAIGSFRQ